MKVAAVIGHDKFEQGAYSPHLMTTEFVYNSKVASYLACDFDIYKRPTGGGYRTKMINLAKEINPKKYDLVFELHFNSFNSKANGCEVLIWKGNKYSYKVGDKLCEDISEQYSTNNRGVKEIWSDEQRGYWFLSLIEAPAMILEPFFGDAEESLKFENPGYYAEVITRSICS